MSGRSARGPSKNLADWANGHEAPEGHAPVTARGALEAYEYAGIPLKRPGPGVLGAYVPVIYNAFLVFILVLQRRIRNREYIPPFYRQQYFGQWKRWFERRGMEEMLRHFHRFQEGRGVPEDYRDLFGYFAEYCLNNETIPGPEKNE